MLLSLGILVGCLVFVFVVASLFISTMHILINVGERLDAQARLEIARGNAQQLANYVYAQQNNIPVKIQAEVA